MPLRSLEHQKQKSQPNNKTGAKRNGYGRYRTTNIALDGSYASDIVSGDMIRFFTSNVSRGQSGQCAAGSRGSGSLRFSVFTLSVVGLWRLLGRRLSPFAFRLSSREQDTNHRILCPNQIHVRWDSRPVASSVPHRRSKTMRRRWSGRQRQHSHLARAKRQKSQTTMQAPILRDCLWCYVFTQRLRAESLLLLPSRL